MSEFRVLTSLSELEEAAERIAAGTGPIAVDAERASGFRYSQRAYLVQVFRRESGTFLIDPPEIEDFTPLYEAMVGHEWVFHAASQDLSCLREIGLEPASIFDTELAARLLGRERVGLGAVVEEELGIILEKAHSAADWSTRPLPQSWLEYAAFDVELLVDVRDKLDAALHQSGKREIAAQEFEAVLSKQPKAPAEEPWRKLSGIHSLKDPRRLAVARELWLARDEYAREVDTAPGRIVPDAALLALAQALPTSRTAMVATPGFHGRASRAQAERWWEAIERGRHTPEVPAVRATQSASLPPPRTWAQRNPDADKRFTHAREAISELAQVIHMPVENLLTPEILRQVCWAPEGENANDIAQQLARLGARPWQSEACAEVIADAFVHARQNEGEEPPPIS